MKDIHLKVAKAYPNDSARGIARLDPNALLTLRLSPGDIIEIEGMELPGNPSLRPSKRGSFTDALYFSIAMFTTSQAPVNTYPVGFYRHLAMAEGILGWFFLGLFVVVLSAVLIR